MRLNISRTRRKIRLWPEGGRANQWKNRLPIDRLIARMCRLLPGKPPPCRQTCNASVRLWNYSASGFWMRERPIRIGALL